MKNATKHAEDLRAIFKKLMRECKPEPMQAQEPLKALVRGAMSYDVSNDRADAAIRAIEKEFVDLNELRVATDLEIQELLGVRYPNIEDRVALITQSLNAIFEKEHTLSLERLKTISKRDARQFLRDLPQMVPAVEAYVMLFAFDGHAVPIDNEMAAYLKREEIVDEAMTTDDIQRFVEHHVKAEECHDFYICLRETAHESGEKKRAKGK